MPNPSYFNVDGFRCLCTQVWLVEDGKVQEYPGYFEDYKEELVKEIAAEMEDDEPVGPTKP